MKTTTSKTAKLTTTDLFKVIKAEIGKLFEKTTKGCVNINLTDLFRDKYKCDYGEANVLATKVDYELDSLAHKGCTFKLFKSNGEFVLSIVKVCAEFKSLNTYLQNVIKVNPLRVFDIYSVGVDGKRDDYDANYDYIEFLSGNKDLCRNILARFRKERKTSWEVERKDLRKKVERDLYNEADYEGEIEWSGELNQTLTIFFKTKGGKSVGSFIIGCESWGFRSERERIWECTHHYESLRR